MKILIRFQGLEHKEIHIKACYLASSICGSQLNDYEKEDRKASKSWIDKPSCSLRLIVLSI